MPLIASPTENMEPDVIDGQSLYAPLLFSLSSVFLVLIKIKRLTATKTAVMIDPTNVDVSFGKAYWADSSSERRNLARGQVGEHIVPATTPVAIKVRTATKDLLLNLARPQIPWPVVHPFPS